MANIIEIANSAYEARDKAQENLALLIQQADREKTEFEKEMQQVTSLMNKDKQMQELVRMKENEKNEIERNTLANNSRLVAETMGEDRARSA